MSEPTTSESEAPRKVAKKKGRAKASRKKAAKPSGSAPQVSDAPESHAASADVPPPSPASTDPEPSASAPSSDPTAEPKNGRNHAPPAAHAEREDRTTEKASMLSDNGSPAQRTPEDGSKGRGQDRGQGGTAFQENRNARNRRRNRGDRDRGGNHPSANAQRRVPEIAIDMEELKAKAWHIYSTEVCEEGIRFVDDTDAGKLVRRCYKLAETFLRFQYRQQGGRPDRDDSGPPLDTDSSGQEEEADVVTPF